MEAALPGAAALGGIASTDPEIESARQEQRRPEGDAAAVQLPIALIDSLLSELEVLNLVGCRRVPESLQPSLRWLFGNCPVQCPPLSTGSSPVHLMDALFDLQESLLALQGGAFRRRLQRDDECRTDSHYS
jgi:hypothetical protein